LKNEDAPVQRVVIADTTLRDEHLVARDPRLLADKPLAEIWRSNALPTAKRILVARQLATLGVDVIEAGFGDATDGLGSLRGIASEFRQEGPEISGLVRTLAGFEQLADASKAVSAAARPRIHLYTTPSELVDDSGRFRRQPRQLLDEAQAAVEQARHHVDNVEFSPPQGGRDYLDITAEWAQAAIAAGAKTINLRTTAEYASASEYRAVLLELFQLVPQSQDVIISADPFVPHLRGAEAMSMALESAEAAIDAGCRQIKCAFHGIAGTPGHAPLELIAFNLWLRHQLGESPLQTNIDTHKLLATSNLIADAKGFDLPPTQPLVGTEAIDPQPSDFPDDPRERWIAADFSRNVLRALGRTIPSWLDDWADTSQLEP
jgi:2-isopropylmalate synthase